LPKSFDNDLKLFNFIPLHIKVEDLDLRGSVDSSGTRVSFDNDGFISLTSPKLTKGILHGKQIFDSPLNLILPSSHWTMAFSDFVVTTSF